MLFACGDVDRLRRRPRLQRGQVAERLQTVFAFGGEHGAPDSVEQ